MTRNWCSLFDAGSWLLWYVCVCLHSVVPVISAFVTMPLSEAEQQQ